jgi:hypothetical protein
VVEEKPVKPVVRKGPQAPEGEYSENIKRIQAEAENEVVAQK